MLPVWPRTWNLRPRTNPARSRVFYARSRTREGRRKLAVLFRVTSLRIRRHVRIQARREISPIWLFFGLFAGLSSVIAYLGVRIYETHEQRVDS